MPDRPLTSRPPGDRILLRGAHVVTMVPGRPDAERVDILIEDGWIRQLAARIDVSETDVVDLDGRIVIPGLINAHLHTWQSTLRSIGADWSLQEYLVRAHGEIAHRFTAEDMRTATLLGALNQIQHGVTAIGDWCHNCTTPEHAEAAIDALNTAGIRAVFMHGTPHGLRDRPHDMQAFDRLANGSLRSHRLITPAMAISGPQLSSVATTITDLRAAADRDVLVSMHQSAGPPSPGWAATSRANLWGPKTNIVHGTGLPVELVRHLVEQGVTFTTTPENELGQGHCSDLAAKLLSVNSAPSLGTDTEIAVPGDVLVAARILLSDLRAQQHNAAHTRTGLGAARVSLTAKDALSWATIEGARALALSNTVGTLQTGKAADLVVLSSDQANLLPVSHPVAAAVHADPSTIEAVMVGGRWRKRNHRLVDVDVQRLRADVDQSSARLLQVLSADNPIARIRRRIITRVVTNQLRKQAANLPAP